MRVRFTKKADGRHRLTVLRDDGTVSQGRLIPGLAPDAIPHDLLHALVEKTLEFSRGVYGMVNAGLEIAELLDPLRKQTNRGEVELMHSEVITTALQAEDAYEGVGEDLLRAGWARQCRELRLEEPSVSDEQLRRIRSLRGEYSERWRELGVGETVEVDVTPHPTGRPERSHRRIP